MKRIIWDALRAVIEFNSLRSSKKSNEKSIQNLFQNLTKKSMPQAGANDFRPTGQRFSRKIFR